MKLTASILILWLCLVVLCGVLLYDRETMLDVRQIPPPSNPEWSYPCRKAEWPSGFSVVTCPEGIIPRHLYMDFPTTYKTETMEYEPKGDG
jgi:hypothetical protein